MKRVVKIFNIVKLIKIISNISNLPTNIFVENIKVSNINYLFIKKILIC